MADGVIETVIVAVDGSNVSSAVEDMLDVSQVILSMGDTVCDLIAVTERDSVWVRGNGESVEDGSFESEQDGVGVGVDGSEGEFAVRLCERRSECEGWSVIVSPGRVLVADALSERLHDLLGVSLSVLSRE